MGQVLQQVRLRGRVVIVCGIMGDGVGIMGALRRSDGMGNLIGYGDEV